MHATPQQSPALTQLRLGQQIKRLREERRMTQGALARGICFRTYISQIEQGIRFPTARVLAQLAERLDVPLTQFIPAYLHAPESAPTQCLALANLVAERGAIEAAADVLQFTVSRLREEMRPDAYVSDVMETEGLIHYYGGHWSDARESFRQALEIRQRVPSRRYALGRTSVRYGIATMVTGRLGEATGVLAEAFYQILQLNPEAVPESTDAVIYLHERVVEALGYCLLRAHAPWLAAAVYRMATARWHDYGILADPSPPLQLGRALALFSAGHPREAQQIIEGLLPLPGPSDAVARAHNNAGLWARLQGNWAESARHQATAWRLWEQTGTGDPLFTTNELARCSLQDNDFTAALAWLKDKSQAPAATAAGATTDPLQVTVRWLLRVRASLLQSDWPAAASYLDAAQNHLPAGQTDIERTIFLRLCALLKQKLDERSVDGALTILDEMDAMAMPQPYAAMPPPTMP